MSKLTEPLILANAMAIDAIFQILEPHQITALKSILDKDDDYQGLIKKVNKEINKEIKK